MARPPARAGSPVRRVSGPGAPRVGFFLGLLSAESLAPSGMRIIGPCAQVVSARAAGRAMVVRRPWVRARGTGPPSGGAVPPAVIRPAHRTPPARFARGSSRTVALNGKYAHVRRFGMGFRATMPDLKIATRKSPLALWQAEHVASALRKRNPGLDVELVAMRTSGDRLLDAPLAKVGGKGLFIKELERALLDGRADIAVHSMKDVPVELPPELHLPVIMARADPRDALVSMRFDSLDTLPPEASVGDVEPAPQVPARGTASGPASCRSPRRGRYPAAASRTRGVRRDRARGVRPRTRRGTARG